MDPFSSISLVTTENIVWIQWRPNLWTIGTTCITSIKWSKLKLLSQNRWVTCHQILWFRNTKLVGKYPSWGNVEPKKKVIFWATSVFSAWVKVYPRVLRVNKTVAVKVYHVLSFYHILMNNSHKTINLISVTGSITVLDNQCHCYFCSYNFRACLYF